VTDQPYAGEGDGDGEDQPALAGASGDDISAGTSVSGLGGEALRTSAPEAGMPPVEEDAARTGWGREAGETGIQPPATHDRTGQSEKPAD